jgi:hypothetical protein
VKTTFFAGCVWALLAVVGFSQPVLAQEDCPPEFRVSVLKDALFMADQALEQADVEYAQMMLSEIHATIPCLMEPVDRKQLARFARNMAYLNMLNFAEDQAMAWAALYKTTYPGIGWPDEIDEKDEKRLAIIKSPIPEKKRAKGRYLAPPAGGAIFLDGKFIDEAVAVGEIPHFVQVFDDQGSLKEAFWQDGVFFADRVLSSKQATITKPLWLLRAEDPLKDAFAAVAEGDAMVDHLQEKKNGSGSNVVLIGAAGCAVLSGAFYALATMQASQLVDAPTKADVDRLRSTANAMVITSGVMGAGAVGFGVVMLTSDTSGLSINGRF